MPENLTVISPGPKTGNSQILGHRPENSGQSAARGVDPGDRKSPHLHISRKKSEKSKRLAPKFGPEIIGPHCIFKHERFGKLPLCPRLGAKLGAKPVIKWHFLPSVDWCKWTLRPITMEGGIYI